VERAAVFLLLRSNLDQPNGTCSCDKRLLDSRAIHWILCSRAEVNFVEVWFILPRLSAYIEVETRIMVCTGPADFCFEAS